MAVLFNTVYVILFFFLNQSPTSAKLPKNNSKSLPWACSLWKKGLWIYHHIQAASHLCWFPQIHHGKLNATSSHSEPHVRSHFEIIKGTGMNSPWGTNLITARNFASASVWYLIWIDGLVFTMSRVLEVTRPLELYSSLNAFFSFRELFLFNSFRLTALKNNTEQPKASIHFSLTIFWRTQHPKF